MVVEDTLYSELLVKFSGLSPCSYIDGNANVKMAQLLE